jgi:hypothetical protein
LSWLIPDYEIIIFNEANIDETSKLKIFSKGYSSKYYALYERKKSASLLYAFETFDNKPVEGEDSKMQFKKALKREL